MTEYIEDSSDMAPMDDIPSGMVEFAELMIDDDRIPKDVKMKWWGFINKDTILTRSENSDRWEASNDFAIRRNVHMMSQPAYKNNIEGIVEMDNIRRRFMTQHRRSIGGFERQALMTQIRELRRTETEKEPSGGIFDGIKKKFGFGPKPKQEVPYGS